MNTVFGPSPEMCPLIETDDHRGVTILSLSQRDFVIASFLDERLLSGAVSRTSVTWADIETAVPAAAENLDYIFHVGHVGSTLLSRVLGQAPTVFAIREPAVLRRVAELYGPAEAGSGAWSMAQWQARLGGLLRLWSRTWQPPQRTLLKATSSVGEIAQRLVERGPARAILLTVAPETYAATILGGPASRVELEHMAPSRLARLNRRLGGEAWRLDALSEGERAAMSWACEMAGLAAAAASRPQACRWLDFEDLLAAPQEQLSGALAHLGRHPTPQLVESLAASPYFGRYSKAPEYGYSPDLRRQVLDQARAEHQTEMRRALAWLERAAADHPLIAGLISWQA